MKWFNHADGSIEFTFIIKSSQHSCVFANWTMFSDWKLNVLHAHPLIKSGFLFFLGGGCHVWMLPLHSWCVCMCDSSCDASVISVIKVVFSYWWWSLTVAVSLFCLVLMGLLPSLFLNGIEVKKNCNKRKV